MVAEATPGPPLARGGVAGRRAWTPAEDDVLRATYKRGYRRVQAALPDRARASIFRRMNKLGLYTHRHWTPEETERLRGMWESGDLRLSAMARELGRTPKATYDRAQQLGLSLGLPPGHEYLSDAARRSGYSSTSTLRRILKWARVQIHIALSRPTKKPRRAHYVLPEDVDDAIARWHQTEPLERAAERVGVCGATLRKALLAAGVKEPKRERKQTWRVHSDDVARAMAARAERKIA